MGGVSVSSSRSQDPLVAGISLSSVPYTGFEAGPMLTALFYALLLVWGVAVAYVLVVRGGSVLGVSVATGSPARMPFVAPSVAPLSSAVRTTLQTANGNGQAAYASPTNLPTADYKPVIGYSSETQQYVVEEEPKQDTEDAMSMLENTAHERNALLSSDAIRFIIEQTPKLEEQLGMLDLVIEQAKASYPTEDGWVVINKERIMSLLS
jgi:hypothetical protein